LNISLIGCPECTSNVLLRGAFAVLDDDASDSVARVRYVGFVSQVIVGYRAASPNIARGKGCWGMMMPEGSDSPGRICIGMVLAMS